MARKNLTDRFCRTAAAGRYSDGNNLYFTVTPSGSRRWTFRYRLEGRNREAGLGSYPVVTLAEARDAAFEAKRLVHQGIDPIEQRGYGGRSDE